MDKKAQFNILYFLAALIGIFLLQLYFREQLDQVQILPYSKFEELAKARQVDNLLVTEHLIRGTLTDDSGQHEFVTTRVDPAVASELRQLGLTFSGGTESNLLRDIVSWVAPILVFFGLWVVLFRFIGGKQGLGGGFMTIGKSRAKTFVETIWSAACGAAG